MKLIKILCVLLAAATISCVWLTACANENEPAKEEGLGGKTIYWLGSSVTYGAASGGVSMADLLSRTEKCKSVKEAVSGTTLFTDPDSVLPVAYGSYTQRLTNSFKFKKDEKVDAFICQISTNDAQEANLSKWGEVTAANVTSADAFNLVTTAGALEYIIAYVEQVWNCPVFFYSGAYFGDGVYEGTNGSDYAALIELTCSAVEKWNNLDGYEVGVIDMFNDEQFNDISAEQYSEYMSDAVHPTAKGYEEWWTPYFADYLVDYFG